VEVQLQPTEGRENYFKRSLYYWAKVFVDQLQPGQSYSDLEKTICISLLDFHLFPETEALHTTYVIKEKDVNRPFLDLLELHYIELRKFSLDKPHKLRTPFEKWLHILKFSGPGLTKNRPLSPVSPNGKGIILLPVPPDVEVQPLTQFQVRLFGHRVSLGIGEVQFAVWPEEDAKRSVVHVSMAG